MLGLLLLGAGSVVPHPASASANRGGEDETLHLISTTTLVDLITATARQPTLRSRSSTASRLMRETTRCGPAWMSTWAITVSLTIEVTMPRSRLRADEPWSSGDPANERAKPARSSPEIIR